MALFLLLYIAGCDDSGTPSQDPCLDVTCSGNGVCIVQYDNAVCNCFHGFHSDELDCVPDSPPCDTVTCSGHGTCIDDGLGNLSCDCDEGYVQQELDCIAEVQNCGNGALDPGEECDTTDLNNQTCASLLPDQSMGELACSVNCTFDTEGCTSSVCGDDLAQGTEECDGTDLRGVFCDDLITGTTGTLTCTGACTLDISGCIAPLGNIGAPCTTSSQCVSAAATCLTEALQGMPSGYCVTDCDSQGACTEAGTDCLSTSDFSLCAKTCTLGGDDCRDGYICVDIGNPLGICWAGCTAHSQCPSTGHCDIASGFCNTQLEDCLNGLDDDLDGAADCADDDCASSPNCVCSEDSLNNQSSSNAYVLGMGSLPVEVEGQICGPVFQDWFRFTTTNSFPGQISLIFTNSVGDLDLGLYNSALSVIDASSDVGDIETISYSFQAATTYYIAVVGYEEATGPYLLRIAPSEAELDATILANPTSGVPGGSVELGVTLHNLGGITASGVTASLSSADSAVTITDGSAAFGNIVPGGSASNAADPLIFNIAVSHIDNLPVSLSLTVTDIDGGSWVFPVSVPVPSAKLDISDFSINDSSGDNDGNADPGESVSLGFGVMNTGALTAAGPISVTVTMDPGSTVVGASLSPAGSSLCSSANLAAGTSAICPSRTLAIPSGAVDGQSMVLNFAFTDADGHAWVSQKILIVGPPIYASILSAFDPQNDNGAYACDLKDVLVHVDTAQTLKVKLLFYSACTISGIHDLYLADGNTTVNLTLTLEEGAKAIWSNNGGSWNQIASPAGFSVTPMSGSTSFIEYSIPVAQIPHLTITGNTLWMSAAVSTSIIFEYTDYAPDATGSYELVWVSFTW